MFDNRKNKRAFRKAQTRAGENEVVCGTLDKDGKPIYFNMPRTASLSDVRSVSFELRFGRPMTPFERKLLEIAEGTNDARH
jgi:hypothetical protein